MKYELPIFSVISGIIINIDKKKMNEIGYLDRESLQKSISQYLCLEFNVTSYTPFCVLVSNQSRHDNQFDVAIHSYKPYYFYKNGYSEREYIHIRDEYIRIISEKIKNRFK